MATKRQHRLAKQEGVSIPATKEKKVPQATATGLNSMANWLVLILLILPLAYSRATMDALLSVRYIILSIFLGLFVAYFFLYRKQAVFDRGPVSVKRSME